MKVEYTLLFMNHVKNIKLHKLGSDVFVFFTYNYTMSVQKFLTNVSLFTILSQNIFIATATRTSGVPTLLKISRDDHNTIWFYAKNSIYFF